MANHGSKFVSVNLNKSYGQHQHQNQSSHHTHYTQFNGPGAGRGRAGGGMLVLSRARAAPKVAPKLSFPPPLNLPSLRKEHEKSDISGSGGPAGGGSGSGSRPNSSGMGWTKPNAAATSASPEKNESFTDLAGVDGTSATTASRGAGSYMPPSARSGSGGFVGPASAGFDIMSSTDKSMLRGEDFPSLQAARPVSSGTPQKQKDVISQKQKHVVRDDERDNKEENRRLGSLDDTGSPGQSSSDATGNRFMENGGKGHGIQKKDGYFQDPLPLVRMNPRSNWADDERDTGHGFVEHRRDVTEYSNNGSYWDRDFDLPRQSILPHKPASSQYGRWGQRDNETGKKISSEVLKMDLYSKDTRASSREGREVNKWRNLPNSGPNDNMANENKYAPPQYGGIGHNWNQQHQQQQRNNADRNIHHVTEQPYRYRADNFQSNDKVSKSSFAPGSKMHHIADPILNMGRDKRYSNSDRDYGATVFDERDLFSEGFVGVIKRKKDTAASTHFHDPVRESFEAELDRVQKMQELERQRVIEEQERAVEQAQREEDERHRRIKEEEERLQRMEEEARETAWRAEQERVEAIQKAEEQRIAREEEKKRIQLEEERRKLAAKQKLEELEARMAMRRSETSKMAVEEKPEVEVKEKLVSGNLDLDTWEDNERMVENVMNSGSFDSSSHTTTVEMSSRPYPPREGSSIFSDKGKDNDNNVSWKRDLLLENGATATLPTPPMSDMETGHYGPMRDPFDGGRANPQKEFYGGAGYMPSRGYIKPPTQEPYSDEFGYHKDQRWNSGNITDPYGKFREMDSEFHDGITNKYGGDNSGWGQGRPRVNPLPPYPERLYPNSEASDLYNNYGRTRYSMRQGQPRVLPPPSRLPSQRPNNPGVTEHAGPSSAFLDNRVHYMHADRTESSAYYGSSNRGGLLEPSEIFGLQQENNNSEDKNLNEASRYGSQSSLSVSSHPTSPPHLSHDELDESIDAHVTSSIAAVHNVNSGLMVSDNISSVEDEEWIVENGDTMQQQEEYDEDEDGYREEEEVRERDDGNLELTQNVEGLELEEAESPHGVENVVLGFDEGVEVALPNDDFDKNLEVSKSSVGIVEERGTIDLSSSVEPNVTNPDEVGRHVGDSSSDTVLAAQQIASSTAATSQAYNNMSSSSGGQADIPIKLQFGLFSGPSLIPSPVPAIQIGSIQMPLHIHPPVGQPMVHMHQSHPPMFQFGQLRYTSPISQGILPMGSQSMSFLHQPNMLGHFNIVQNGSSSVTHEPSRENVIELPSLPKNNSQQSFVSRENPTKDTILKADRNGISTSDDKTKSASDEKTKQKSFMQSSKSRAPENRPQSIGGDRNYGGPRGLGPGPLSGGRGRRFSYEVKNRNMGVMNVQDRDMATDPSGIQRRTRRTVQRTEFRVRENYDRKSAVVPFNNSRYDDNRPNYTGKAGGVFVRSGSKRSTISNRTITPAIESEPSVSGNATSQEVSGDKAAKKLWVNKSQNTSHPGEASLRRNASEEDVDAPLQSGVVRVFKQPGIEAPSDEDDFIEVRSKRQMLNDRREQKEKEIKAKSRTTKPPRKPHASRPRDVVRSYNNNKPLASGEMKSPQLGLASENPRFAYNDVSTGHATAASQPPIGTPPINSDAQSIKSTQAGFKSVVSNGGKEREPGLLIDSKNKLMSLSQSQIDDAMKPSRYDSRSPTVGTHSSTVSDPILPTPPILTKDKPFSSGASPINSLLAGEKIQFGAVTSPTILPPSSRIVSHGIGAPGSNSNWTEPQMNQSFSEKEDSLFFSKEKQLTTERVQDCEAEAAASAVAVAAISSDETVGNESNSVNDTKSFSTAGIKSIPTGVVSHQHLTSQTQTQSEESLSVSLPADLSVETTPISMWPPLPSPQNSSSQMLSHFPTGLPSGLPSHFPFYEMNPFGGPIIAFNPHEESSNMQSQPQKSNWHSGMDSFYGAPPGYPGPFIGPPGGPPHMVVYNHFAPVGQYGQVGLSFMGTTYIPSGKQVDWKNNASEGDSSNVNMGNAQRSGPSMTGPIQHLAPGSQLLPMPPPMPMFDVSPFQTAPDLPLQSHWGHIPASPLHHVVSQPPQPQIEPEPAPTSQVNNTNRFVESRAPSNDNIPSFTNNTNIAPIPSPQLGLPDQTSESSNVTGESSKNAGSLKHAGSLKPQFPKKNTNNNGGYGYQRGGAISHNRNNNEFSHRRMGYHGRNQFGGAEKGFHPSKVKQVYVAKQPTSGRPTT